MSLLRRKHLNPQKLKRPEKPEQERFTSEGKDEKEVKAEKKEETAADLLGANIEQVKDS